MTHFLVLCYLDFGAAHPYISQLSFPSRPPPTSLPSSEASACLLSPPRSCPSHGIGEAPESTMPRCASGKVSQEPTVTASSLQAAVNTQTARVLLNTASQSHLSHCVKQSSIHPPDKIHSYPLPLQAPEVLNLFPSQLNHHLPQEEPRGRWSSPTLHS